MNNTMVYANPQSKAGIVIFKTKYASRTSEDQVLVTPELADYILQHCNINNRAISKATVDSYVNDIRNGKWKDNGERVKFDKNGALLDGQHRLDAIRKSGIPQLVDMVFGLEPDIIGTFDRQRPRTNGDDYNIKYGTKNGSVLASRARSIKNLFNSHRTKTSFSLIEDVIEDFNEGLRISCNVITSRSGVGKASVQAAFVIAAQAFPVKVRKWLMELKTASVTDPAMRTLFVYLNFGSSDNEDTYGKKALFALWAALEDHNFQRLLTTKHDEILKYFVDEIEKKKALKSIDRIV